MCHLLVIPYVASSLTIAALGSSDPIGGIHLRTLSIGRPTTIM
jgi:hypothetical protein